MTPQTLYCEEGDSRNRALDGSTYLGLKAVLEEELPRVEGDVVLISLLFRVPKKDELMPSLNLTYPTELCFCCVSVCVWRYS